MAESGVAPDRAAANPQRRTAIGRAVTLAGLFAGLAYAVLLWPYARGLWWLHVHRQPAAALLIPVAGVPARNLQANFGAPRRGHMHEGIDIMSPASTPVLATASGVVIGNRRTPIGGIVLWILGSGRRLYYYAHMRELAPGMRMGRYVETGTQIGTVGNTGNAANTPPHLHFAIYEVTSSFYPLRYHPIDPYPLLAAIHRRSATGRRAGQCPESEIRFNIAGPRRPCRRCSFSQYR